jgi:hypothetical protein
MDKFHQEIFDVLIKSHKVIKRGSKAASLTIGINKAQLINDLSLVEIE